MTTEAITTLQAHVAAFNDRKLHALLAGFTDDAEWVTGKYTCRGKAELRELFEGAFGAIAPRLEIVRVVPGEGLVAAELVEHMIVDGHAVRASIAGFYTLSGDRIRSAKIYREGSADIPAVEPASE